eukprot:SAG11_NODE_261_length_11530_cov_8.418861_13_plen_129_part_00
MGVDDEAANERALLNGGKVGDGCEEVARADLPLHHILRLGPTRAVELVVNRPRGRGEIVEPPPRHHVVSDLGAHLATPTFSSGIGSLLPFCLNRGYQTGRDPTRMAAKTAPSLKRHQHTCRSSENIEL